jgi:GNAT superfamily N-acetyltransferase
VVQLDREQEAGMLIAEGRWEATLDDLERIEIRIAGPQDAGAVGRFIEGLSEDSRWLRYHSPVPIVRPWMIDTIVANDHEQREALIALHDGRVVGLAEWGREEPGATTADVAIVVDEAFRRRGVARELVRHLTANAREHGISELLASVLSVNRPTINLIQHLAPTRSATFDGPVVEMRIPITQTG